MNSIEILDAKAWCSNDLTTCWEIIHINQIPHRSSPLVASLSPNEVLIAGGRSEKEGYLGDGYVFKLSDESVT